MNDSVVPGMTAAGQAFALLVREVEQIAALRLPNERVVISKRAITPLLKPVHAPLDLLHAAHVAALEPEIRHVDAPFTPAIRLNSRGVYPRLGEGLPPRTAEVHS